MRILFLPFISLYQNPNSDAIIEGPENEIGNETAWLKLVVATKYDVFAIFQSQPFKKQNNIIKDLPNFLKYFKYHPNYLKFI